MTWEKKITLGNLLELGAMLFAVVIFFTTLKSDVNALNQEAQNIRKDLSRVEAYQSQFVTKDVYVELKVQMEDIKKSLETLNAKLDRQNK